MAQDGRDVAGNVVRSLVRYVQRAVGDEGVERVRQLARSPSSVEELFDQARWYPYAEVIALADAAAAVTGDEGIGRRAGEEMMRSTREQRLDNFVRAAGSPGAALANLVSFGSKMASGRQLEPIEIADDHVVLRGWYEGLEPHPFVCSFGPGYWAQVPALFGATGTVIEERCQGRGDQWCIYRVRWEGPVVNPDSELVDDSAGTAEALIAAFERLQRTASELAQAESLDQLLEHIVIAADRALVAPAFVAAVRSDSGRIVAAGRGVPRDEVYDCATTLFINPADTTWGSPVVVPLASQRGEYGLLAALLPPAAAVSDIDRRVLGAYAGHATAVLEAVLARELAERSDEISTGLLHLAQTLSVVATPAEVCDRVVAAVPTLIDCTTASVWRWDAVRRRLELAAHTGPAIEHTSLSEDDVNGLGGLDTARSLVMLDIDELAAIKLIDDMSRTGIVQAAIAPVRARGDFLGLVTAGFVDRRRANDEDLYRRLHGLADLAATALDNALLVERMRHQALHDALTGLPNRPLIEDRVHQAIRRAERKGHGLALMFIDLDRFKNVNDTLGHTAGDGLIKQVAARLSDAVRAEDTLARMGGDEFVLLLPAADEHSAELVAEKLVEVLRSPFELDGRQLYISCSIGISLWPLHGDDYEHLLLHADAAMYEAKARGRNTYAIHSGMTTRRRELLDLENRLHTAIEQDELVVLYQPQVDLASMRVVGVEALVRWDHRDLGRLTPDRFLHLAEESGVITRIDEWVRRHAFAQARAWVEAGTPLRMSVNLSTADLRRPELPKELDDAIRTVAVDPSLIELEITDRVALGEEDLRPTLQTLAAIGARLAVDDFGVGSSVLGRLQHGPFHTLKIDRSLVTQIDDDRRQAAILQALVTMARELGLTVVAEGVETVSQGDVLRSFGCEVAQGYLFSRPVAAEAIDDLVRSMAIGAPLGR